MRTRLSPPTRAVTTARALVLAALLWPPATAAVSTASARSAAGPPGQAVVSETLALGSAADGLKVATKPGAGLVVRRVTLAPGAGTSWHYHRGDLLTVVVSSVLTRYGADCKRREYRAGQAYQESHGPVHLERNETDRPVVLYVTYLVPKGKTLATDAWGPDCGRRARDGRSR